LSILRALSHLHESGISHRDIKPDNIIVRGSEAVLVDFGVAKWPLEMQVRESYTATEDHLTTWKYMPPEVEEDTKLYRPSSDMWSMGLTMIEALCQRRIPRVHALLCHMSPYGTILEKLSLSPSIINAVAELLSRDPKQRPAASLLSLGLEAYIRIHHEWAQFQHVNGFHRRTSSLELFRQYLTTQVDSSSWPFSPKLGVYFKDQYFNLSNDVEHRILSGNLSELLAKYMLMTPQIYFSKGMFEVRSCPKCGGNFFVALPLESQLPGPLIKIRFCLGRTNIECDNFALDLTTPIFPHARMIWYLNDEDYFP
jgi:serine/threonine protein kinase